MRWLPHLPVKRLTVGLCLAMTAAALSGCGSSNASSKSSAATATSMTPTATSSSNGPPLPAGAMGFEGVPIETGPLIAPASTTGTAPVDGISCGPIEQLAYHIHAHLLVYLNGQPRALPGGIGIPGSTVEMTNVGPVALGGHCIYWLHTHAPDGVIHIESPTRHIYTLGEFFDEWHQPLSSTEVGTLRGVVHAVVNGKRWTGNPRDIRLEPHTQIQFDIGKPDPPFTPISWAKTQL